MRQGGDTESRAAGRIGHDKKSLRGSKFGRKIHRADKIKIPLRFGREIFLGVYDGEDAEIFQPNALVVNGAD